MTEYVDSGLQYCLAHHGVIECDASGPCDFVDSDGDRCPRCDGVGVLTDETNEDDNVLCGACDGEGVTPCQPTELLYRAATT